MLLHQINKLNVAGPHESQSNGIYQIANELLKSLFLVMIKMAQIRR